MDPRERRLAENEAMFREVNERIRETADSRGRDNHVFEFLCECSNVDCTLRLELTTQEYENVRVEATRFLTAKGHNLPEIEDVVEERDGYQVVEKRGGAAEIVEQTNPR